MDQTFVIFTAAIMQILAFSLIIIVGTKASARAKYARAQMELLAQIAKAQGVTMDDIQRAVDGAK